MIGLIRNKSKTPESVAMSHNRRAATLVEILMSLMVMGVGLVTVASLFPLAVVRSIQATQLTNAAMLNYQVEDYMQAFPERLRDHFHSLDSTGYGGLPTGVYLPSVEFTSESVHWNRVGAANVAEFSLQLPLNYTVAVDPVGFEYYRRQHFASPSASLRLDATRYGSDPLGIHNADPRAFEPRYSIDRKSGGFNLGAGAQIAQAYEMFVSRDSWTEQYKSTQVTIDSATELTLGDVAAADVAVFATTISSSRIAGRVVVYNETGRETFITGLVNVTGNQIELSQPLPSNGLYDFVPQVQLEILEPRYSAMVTVRQQLVSLGPDGQPGVANVDDDNRDGDGNPSTDFDSSLEIGWPGSDDVIRYLGADLVVFFRRDFSKRSEQMYAVENLVRQNAGLGVQDVRVYWDSSKGDSGKPLLKTGAWMFDSVNGYWYQIRSVIVADGPTTELASVPQWVAGNNDRYAAVQLDRVGEANAQFVMIPNGVVEVYEFPIQ